MERLIKELESIKKEMKYLRALMMGNGKIGVAEMARRAFDYMNNCKKTKQGYLDWAFRGIITLMLGYIAIRIGWK